MAPRSAVPVASAGTAAALRGRLGRRAWADLRRGLELAQEYGCYSVSVGVVCITLRLPQDGAAAGRQPRRVVGRVEQQRQSCSKRCGGRSTTTGAPGAPAPASAPVPTAVSALNSKQRRSRERARQWHAARAGGADAQNEQMLAGDPACVAEGRPPGEAAASTSSCVLPMQVEQTSAVGQGSTCTAECRPPGEAAACATRCVPASAAARWRRLAAAAVRFSVWRPWAAARARASAAPVLAAAPAERCNLLYDSVDGRIAVADALVACVEAPGRSKRKVEALSDAAALA